MSLQHSDDTLHLPTEHTILHKSKAAMHIQVKLFYNF